MVVIVGGRTARRDGSTAEPSSSTATPTEVVWHDLECGGYRADLGLWRELADRRPGDVLEIGAGTGRVALELANAGHHVTAVDHAPTLLAALRSRDSLARVRAVCSDARRLALEDRDFGLCVVAMQTIQLLGASGQRRELLRRIRAHLRPGGLLACAILGHVEPFDCSAGQVGPEPELARVDGLVFESRPIRVAVRRSHVEIERDRRILAAQTGQERSRERDVVVLTRLSATQLEREGRAAGLRVEAAQEVSPTGDHVGSTVVMLRA